MGRESVLPSIFNGVGAWSYRPGLKLGLWFCCCSSCSSFSSATSFSQGFPPLLLHLVHSQSLHHSHHILVYSQSQICCRDIEWVLLLGCCWCTNGKYIYGTLLGESNVLSELILFNNESFIRYPTVNRSPPVINIFWSIKNGRSNWANCQEQCHVILDCKCIKYSNSVGSISVGLSCYFHAWIKCCCIKIQTHLLISKDILHLADDWIAQIKGIEIPKITIFYSVTAARLVRMCI